MLLNVEFIPCKRKTAAFMSTNLVKKNLQTIIKLASDFQNKEQREGLARGILKQVSGPNFPGCSLSVTTKGYLFTSYTWSLHF